jgi:hypothetical protein
VTRSVTGQKCEPDKQQVANDLRVGFDELRVAGARGDDIGQFVEAGCDRVGRGLGCTGVGGGEEYRAGHAFVVDGRGDPGGEHARNFGAASHGWPQRGFIGGKWHVDFFDPVKGCTGHAQRPDPAGGDGGGEGVVVRGFRGFNWRWIDHGIPFHVTCSLLWTAQAVWVKFCTDQRTV